MIRWQSRQESYVIGNESSRTHEVTKDHLALCVPFVGRSVEIKHTSTSGADKFEASISVNRLDKPFGDRADANAIQSFEKKREFTREPKTLPLITIMSDNSYVLRTDVKEEAFKTGVVCSTTGMVVGLGAWLLGGPVGGALWWMFGGAALFGAGAGAAQARETSNSNDMRNFANRCNDFLVSARSEKLSEGTLLLLQDCAETASTKQMEILLRDVVAACYRHFGETSFRPLQGALLKLRGGWAPAGRTFGQGSGCREHFERYDGISGGFGAASMGMASLGR